MVLFCVVVLNAGSSDTGSEIKVVYQKCPRVEVPHLPLV